MSEGQTQDASDPFAGHEFKVPQTQVKVLGDMEKWTKSPAYKDYLGFVLTLSKAVKGKKSTVECHVSESVKKILNLLGKLSSYVDEMPAVNVELQRFGNKEFRNWYDRLKSEASELTAEILPENLKRASDEISDYLVLSFGNRTRIDYGTGHEAAFASFVCCLYKLRVLAPGDEVAVVTRVFTEYFKLARKVQMEYRMEPAGSQGVWGLDDYQFLPFIFGSSQLIANPDIPPSRFMEKEIVSHHHNDYMFLQCIKYINEVKTGPFAEHSNTLWGISGVPHWSKVNSGLIKMYKAEFLNKFPVIQHFRFGSILSIT